MPTLRARPTVRRVDRTIHLPKAARTVLRPDPAIVKQIRAVVKSRVTPQPQPRATRAQQLAQQQIVRQPPSRRQPIRVQHPANHRRKKPIIRYTNKDVSESSKSKIKAIQYAGRGKILCIFGNGPSLLEVNPKPLKGHDKIDLMSINRPDNRIWPTEYWLFCDTTQVRRHGALWREYNGTTINTTAIKQDKPNSMQVKNIGGHGFSLDLLKGFHVGRSSVYAAMQVALWMGYDEIYVFGIDMCAVRVDGKRMLHYYGVNPDVKPENREKRFDAEAAYYDHAAKNLSDGNRAKFYFCSKYLKYKFAESFNQLNHKKAVEHILKRASGPEE